MKRTLSACNLSLAIIILLLFCSNAIAQNYTLTISKAGSGGGSVSSAPSGINCGATCSFSYVAGTTVTIYAAPDGSSDFTGWTGGGCSGTSSCDIIMNSDKNIIATFTKKTYILTVTVNGTGGGSVNSVPAGIDCGPTCSANFNAGTSVTLTATPNSSSVFNGWTGSGCSGTGTCVVDMSTAKSVTATFNCIQNTYYADIDGDTYGAGAAILACVQPANTATRSGDCNDVNAAIHPGATELCNNLDDDCDYTVDEGLTGVYTFYPDNDGDGYGTGTGVFACVQPPNTSTNNTDCDDNDYSKHEGFSIYIDADNDGYTVGLPIILCTGETVPEGYRTNSLGSDCNDASAAIHPGVIETCNGNDDDCDGSVDEGLYATFYRDVDGDGYGVNSVTVYAWACSIPVGYAALGNDCDDGSNSIHPGATEIVGDHIDQDCDGREQCYYDNDGDHYGSANLVMSSDCDCLDAGEARFANDCDDTNPLIHPGGTEICNGKDDDCDGSTDEGLPLTYADADGDGFGYGPPVTCGPANNNLDCDDNAILYADNDNDGYGAGAPAACGVPNSTDCNDGVNSIHPGAIEIVGDMIDQNCDGMEKCYVDADNDYYGTTGVVTSADCDCTDSGEAMVNTDCNDNDPTMHASFDFYADVDNDGLGGGSLVSVCAVNSTTPPAGFYLFPSDNCPIDYNPDQSNFDSDEMGNACDLDDDNDGVLDTEDCASLDNTKWRSALLNIDNDNDNYDNGTATICYGASIPAGYKLTTLGSDCNDANAAINPGATEICGNGFDDNCNSQTDECFTLTVTKTGGDGVGGIVTSTPAGINCGATCSFLFPQGTDVTLTASTINGATFAGWSGACSGTETCMVTMSSNKSINARFTYNLTVTKSGSGSGTISSVPTGIYCGTTCTASYDAGQSITLNVSASPGSVFNGWSGGACTGTSGCYLTMNSNITTDAMFTCIKPATPGAITGSNSVCPSSSQTYSIDPVADATSYMWTLPSGWIGSSTTNSITATAGSSGTISVTANNSCGASSAKTMTVTVNAFPADLNATGGLVAYYPFNNNANDSSGNGNNGTINGSVATTDRYSLPNSAYNFDGLDDYILIGDPVPATLQIQNEITLSAWIYASQYPSNSNLWLIAGSQCDCSSKGASIFLDGRINSDGQTSPTGHIHFQIGDGAGWHVSNTNSQVPLNQWVHIVATRKANENARIYYNGVLQPLTSVPWTGSVSYLNAYFAIGRQKDYPNRFFKGKIDEVRVYNRVMSEPEVLSLYQTLDVNVVDDTICQNSSTNINLIHSETGVSYQLRKAGVDIGSPQTGTGNTLTFNTGILTAKSQFTIKATNIATACNIILDTLINIMVKELKPVSVSIGASSSFICRGSGLSFTATPTNGGTAPVYQWKLNGYNVGSNSPTFGLTWATFNGYGNPITCVMTSNIECPSVNPAISNEINLNVFSYTTAGVSIVASENPVCAGKKVDFTATPANGGTNPFYQWKRNNINVGTNSPNYSDSTLSTNDIISCVMTSDYECSSGNPATSNLITMTVNPLLPVSVTIEALKNPVCSNTNISLTATQFNGGNSPTYQWKFNGMNVGSNSPTLITTVASWGYRNPITCIMTSDANCATQNPDTSNAINLSVAFPSQATQFGYICEGQSFLWRGTEYSTAGVYDVHFTSLQGCDSIRSLNLTVWPIYAFNESHEICSGEAYTWHGVDYTTSGMKQADYHTSKGCDSTYTLNLIVNPVYAFNESHEICSGETYTWHGVDYTTSGLKQADYHTSKGCDSTYTLDLIVNPVYAINESHEICSGETYTWHGVDYTTAGIKNADYHTVKSCDSTYTLDLIVNPVYAFNESHEICSGETYTWHGVDYTTAGIKNADYHTVKGCDSTYTLYLSVDPSYSFSESQTTCNGQPYNWRGLNYMFPGTYHANFVTAHGCDSIYTLNLSVDPVYAFTENHEICSGQSYLWQGTNYSLQGNYNAYYSTVKGCDSIYTLYLFVNPVYTFNESHEICSGETYTWHGVDYTSPGMKQADYHTVKGCDSTYVLDLIVNPVYAFNESHEICSGETYTWQGVDYTISGIKHADYHTAKGCDSTYTLDLIVNPLPEVSFTGLSSIYCIDNSPVSLTGNPLGGIFTGDGITGNIFDPNTAGAGDHDISYSFTDGNGCETTALITVTVDLCTGVADVNENSGIRVVPNPTDGKFRVLLPNNENCTLLVYDAIGKIIYSLKSNSEKDINIDLGNTANGVYLLKVESGNSIKTARIIIVR